MKLALLLALSLSLLPAQTKQERGRKIVDEMIAALGGQNFLEMKDRVEFGRAYSFYREQLTGLSIARFSTRYPATGKPGELAIEERQAFGKKEDAGAIFAAGKGWQFSFRGARPMPEDTYERYRLSTTNNLFYILRQRLKEPGMTFEYQKTDVYDNAPVNVVDITDGENRTVTVYIHASTKLPMRQIYFRRDPKTRDRNEEVTTFSKFRDVGGGVQWPFAIQRERNGEKLLELYSDTVSINQDLPGSLFQVEGRMTVLPPAK
jgi:hypothetical protein